jgi:ubiquinone/menaquinone biosynthesis C-methylase UbiE
MSDPTTNTDAPYDENAAFWIRQIRQRRDRYRTDFTDGVIVRALDAKPGETIVDAGCGEGWLSRECASAGANVIGVDNCVAFIEAARAANNGDHLAPVFHVGDVRALPVPNASADVVVANHVLTDVPEPWTAVSDFARVLRPGGRFVALMIHPAFYGPQAERRVTSEMPSADEYFASPRIVRTPFRIGGETSPAEVVTHLWSLTSWFEWIIGAGLVPSLVSEPRPGPDLMADPWWQEHFRRPLFLLVEARRATGC